MDENEFKRKFCSVLKNTYGFSTQCHEDKYEIDIADTSFAAEGIDGWIEFKHLKSKPSKTTDIFNYIKFRRGQRLWMIERGEKGGGHVYLILSIEETNAAYIFDIHTNSLMVLDKMTWQEFVSLSSASSIEAAPRMFASLIAEYLDG